MQDMAKALGKTSEVMGGYRECCPRCPWVRRRININNMMESVDKDAGGLMMGTGASMQTNADTRQPEPFCQRHRYLRSRKEKKKIGLEGGFVMITQTRKQPQAR